MAKQERLEITAIPTALEALERLNTAFCCAVYRIESTSPSMPGTVNWCCCVDVLLDVW